MGNDNKGLTTSFMSARQIEDAFDWLLQETMSDLVNNLIWQHNAYAAMWKMLFWTLIENILS